MRCYNKNPFGPRELKEWIWIKTKIKNEKRKKVVDKMKNMWYPIKVVSENNEPTESERKNVESREG